MLVEESTSTLFPIAKDVKMQVEFNPATVSEYRLIGYETRLLNREDFNNDQVDAGEIGSGHTVTAIYEITPAGSAAELVDNLRYQARPRRRLRPVRRTNTAFLKIRYKLPDEDTSKLIETPISAGERRRRDGRRNDGERSPLRGVGRGLRADPSRRPLHRRLTATTT